MTRITKKEKERLNKMAKEAVLKMAIHVCTQINNGLIKQDRLARKQGYHHLSMTFISNYIRDYQSDFKDAFIKELSE